MKKNLIALSAVLFMISSFAFGKSPEFLFPTSTSESIVPANHPELQQPKMKWAPDRFAKDPSVIHFKDRYLLYFSSPPVKINGKETGWTIAIAESNDLVHWKKIGSVLPMQECDQKGLCAPCAKVIGNKVWIFYQTYGTGAKDAICAASSDDGIHFIPLPNNPIFRPSGLWTNGRAIDADLVFFKGKFFLYAATRDPKGSIQKIVVATADPHNGMDHLQWQQAADRSILFPELSWETKCIEAPSVIEVEGSLYMFYAGGYNNDPQHIGVARSPDGIHWTRLWNVPFITNGPKGQWNESESGHPGIFRDKQGDYWLFFQGNCTHGKDWYLSRIPLEWKKDEKGIPYPAIK